MQSKSCEPCELSIGINGFGRIGRMLARKVLMDRSSKLAGINDPSKSAESMAYLLKYDSVHGTFPLEIKVLGPEAIQVESRRIPITNYTDAKDIPWKDLGATFVADTSGQYTQSKLACQHLSAGAKKVIISAPTKDEEMPTFVMGVNDCCYRPNMHIVSNASCTTNCAAPLLKLLNDTYGVEEAFLTTVHSVTASQNCVDSHSRKDPRIGRCCLKNIIPSHTGAAEAVVRVMPDLRGKLNATAFRVPVENVSVVDLSCKLTRPMQSMEDFCRILCDIEQDKNHRLNGIVGVTCDPMVSSDFNGDERSCIVDINASSMVNPNFVKIVAYYDNEWGYATRMWDFMCFISKKESGLTESEGPISSRDRRPKFSTYGEVLFLSQEDGQP